MHNEVERSEVNKAVAEPKMGDPWYLLRGSQWSDAPIQNAQLVTVTAITGQFLIFSDGRKFNRKTKRTVESKERPYDKYFPATMRKTLQVEEAREKVATEARFFDLLEQVKQVGISLRTNRKTKAVAILADALDGVLQRLTDHLEETHESALVPGLTPDPAPARELRAAMRGLETFVASITDPKDQEALAIDLSTILSELKTGEPDPRRQPK